MKISIKRKIIFVVFLLTSSSLYSSTELELLTSIEGQVEYISQKVGFFDYWDPYIRDIFTVSSKTAKNTTDLNSNWNVSAWETVQNNPLSLTAGLWRLFDRDYNFHSTAVPNITNTLNSVNDLLVTSESAIQEINEHTDSINGELSSSAEGSIKNLLEKIVDNTKDDGSDGGTEEEDFSEKLYNALFVDKTSKSITTLNPLYSNAKIDLKDPKSFLYVSGTRTWSNHIIEFLRELIKQQSQSVITETSSLMNLQSIRTNLVHQLTQMQYWSTNYYAKMLVQMTNHIGVVKSPDLDMKSATHFSQQFEVDNMGNYEELKFVATGDFYEDMISLSHYQASAAKGRNYTLYSILTNVQIIANSIITKSPEQLEGEEQISKAEETIEETIEAAQEVENNAGNYIGFKNGISDLQNTANIEALHGGDNMPTEMTINIPSFTFGENGGLSEQMVTIDLTKIEPIIKLIRSGFGILYWGLAIYFVVWLWGHFRTFASKFVEFSSGLVSAGG